MAYVIEGSRKSGVVRFLPDENGTVQSESVSMNSKVTANPVESGSDITDHVVNETARFSISGTIIGGKQAVDTLIKMRDTRDILTYRGRYRLSNLVITSLTFNYSAKNRDGCAFSASFQEVIISSSERVEVGEMPPMSAQDPPSKKRKKTSNAGTQTTSTQSISGSAYAAYVASYSGGSSAGPLTRLTPSHSGAVASLW